MPRNLIKQQGGRPIFAVHNPFYLKHSPGNPWFMTKHDGISPNYGAGFEPKVGSRLNWVYRFKWNSQPIGSGPFYLRNPGGKCPHWLEISGLQKFKVHALGAEALMHTQLACVVTAIVIWNLTRYLFFHPDLTLYNVAYFTLRPYMNMLRNNAPMTLDQPVFRWAQQPPEFYNYHPHREMYELGILANDPYVEYIKSIGKEKELTITPDMYGLGEGGRGKLAATYLPQLRKGEKWEDPTKPPRHWYAGPEGHGPHHHREHDNPNDQTRFNQQPSSISGTILSTIIGGPHKHSEGTHPPKNSH